ncbi:sensor histidine kinase [Methylotenera sp. G11]|uniref:sensor histidine kinase n=1 Tax=Methylotenera sp. G11 TaxID=1506585 RepID=UPI000649145E|nr:sensor histidine kinase [Methylotenera sp. G11]
MLNRPFSVRQVLLAGFFFTALLPMLIMTVLAFYQARTVLHDEIVSGMQTRAIAARSEVDRMMFERLQNVTSWSRLDVMYEAQIGDVDKRLSHFLADLKQSYRGVYQALYVVSPDGRVVASSEPAQIGQPAPVMQPWLNVQLEQHPLQLAVIKQQLLPIASDIIDMDGNKIGTLWAVFDWDEIKAILKNTQSQGSAAALVDEQGKPLAQTAEWRQIVAGHDVSVSSSGSGQAVAPIFKWQVEISQYRSVVMAPVHRMGYMFIFLLVVTAFLATALAAPLSRFITMPLARLTSYANRFMRSSTQRAPPAPDGPVEVRGMTNAFAKMIDDLNLSKENLTRAAKLAVAGEMAAAMSHEIRTPLGILRSSAQVLAREKSLSAEGREVASFITSETERLNKLVSTLVDSARPRQPEFAMHDVVGLLENAVAMLRMQANKKDINLDLDVQALFKEGHAGQDAQRVLVECDGEQITQVILNLLLNAIQILDTGSSVVVTLMEHEDSVTISVADNGKGVDESFREQIFDPFFTQRQGGIGLGLAVSRQIVVAHFGSLTVEASALPCRSGTGYGADFRVRLPKQQLH